MTDTEKMIAYLRDLADKGHDGILYLHGIRLLLAEIDRLRALTANPTTAYVNATISNLLNPPRVP